MAQTWEFANKGEDCTPEIILKAQNPITSGEKVLLFQVLQGCFGRPMILSGTSVNGQASEVIIGFGDATGNQLLEIDKNYDNLEIIPLWNKKDRVSSYIPTYYSYDDGRIKDEFFRVKSLRQKLYFNIPYYNLIKDYNPEITIEKYTPTKGCNTSKSRNFSTAGFKTVPLKSTIPITGQVTEMDFRQEEFFRLKNEIGNLQAKGLRKRNKTVHTFLQFRIRLTINDNSYKTIPLLHLKMQAAYHQQDMAGVGGGELRPDNPDNLLTIPGNVIICYRRV